MNKIIFILLAASISTHALGGWIHSDSMTVGDNVTNAFGNLAILNWANKDINQPLELQSLQVNQSDTEYPGNYSKYFGNSENVSGTANVFDLYLEHAYPIYAPAHEQAFYKALAITFLQPVSTFSFKAESFSGDSQLILFFDSNGNFINHQDLSYTSIQPHPDTGILLDYNYSFDLRDQNIGSVVVGSWSASTYYYALEIEAAPRTAPEPSSALLAISALALLISLRIHKKSPSAK